MCRRHVNDFFNNKVSTYVHTIVGIRSSLIAPIFVIDERCLHDFLFLSLSISILRLFFRQFAIFLDFSFSLSFAMLTFFIMSTTAATTAKVFLRAHDNICYPPNALHARMGSCSLSFAFFVPFFRYH